MLLLRGEDRGQSQGLPHVGGHNQEPELRSLSQPRQFPLQPHTKAPGVGTDGLSLGEEAAPFHPTHMARQRKQNSTEFPSSCLYIYPQRQSKHDEFLLFLNDLTLAK